MGRTLFRYGIVMTSALAASLGCGNAPPAAGVAPPARPAAAAPPADRGDKPMTADEALATLMAGNRRYVAGRPTYPDQSPSRRTLLAAGQHPMAVVLGCSDSRVPPELIF